MEYRFSESVFRKMEHVLKIAVDALPEVTKFNPTPFTVTTFSRKLRDAKRSLVENQWKSIVDTNKLLTYDMVIAERRDVVLTGTSDSISKYSGQQQAYIPAHELAGKELPTLRTIRLTSTHIEVIKAALMLHASGEVDSIILDPSVNVEALATQFDFLYERHPDKILII